MKPMLAAILMLVALGCGTVPIQPGTPVPIEVTCPTTQTINDVTVPLDDLLYIEIWVEWEDAPMSGNFSQNAMALSIEIPEGGRDGLDTDGNPMKLLLDVPTVGWLSDVRYRVRARAGDCTVNTNWSTVSDPGVNRDGEPVLIRIDQTAPDKMQPVIVTLGE